MLPDLVTLVTEDAAVAALIGTRMYPALIPQDAVLPALAYQQISEPGLYSHEGDVGLMVVRMQFTAQATSYASARAVLDALRAVLTGYSGTVNNTHFQAVFVENARDEWAATFERATARLDVSIWHRSAA